MVFGEHKQSPNPDMGGTENQDVPGIYKLIEQDIGVSEIVGEIFKNYHNPEALYLGFNYLLQKGSDGEATIRFIAQNDKGSLGEIATKILESKSVAPGELEQIVGMPDRMKNMMALPENYSHEDVVNFYLEAARYCKEKYGDEVDVPKDSSELNFYLDTFSGHGIVAPQLSGEVEQESLVVSNTFGTAELTYLELNGPEEILRLRDIEKPDLLLLGSMGSYSAREFSAYCKKINSTAKPHVIDRYCDMVGDFAGERDMEFKIADALDLPHEDGSMDQVYTNYLLHSFIHDNRKEINREILSKLFAEINRVLKEKGSFVLAEHPYGLNIGSGGSKENIKELIAVALQNGFDISNSTEGFAYSYVIRQDVIDFKTGQGGAQIDEYGFAKYGDSLIEKLSPSMGFRFQKK